MFAGKVSYDEFAVRTLASPRFLGAWGIFNEKNDLIQIAGAAFRLFMGREPLPSEAMDFGNLFRGWRGHVMEKPESAILFNNDCPLQTDETGTHPNCFHLDVGLDSAH